MSAQTASCQSPPPRQRTCAKTRTESGRLCVKRERIWGVLVPVGGLAGLEPVSYTHLTLPTICSV
eukprot:1245953-Rhodomonas_salina.1